MLISIIIRTLNEETYLDRLIEGIKSQEIKDHQLEIIVVDSGSTDSTLQIARKHGCRITYIDKSDFTFGRSLNVGCCFAKGELLVFISGHCIPASRTWLFNLVSPLIDKICAYTYGRQLGHATTKFSECRLFDKHFPGYSKLPQNGFFCNNANSAITRNAWEIFKFNEGLSGLEDMELAKKIVDSGDHIGYVSDAPVYHIHDETWKQVKTRYEREAYALKSIMPEIQFDISDFLKYFLAGVFEDTRIVIRQGKFRSEFKDILLFRLMHYWGTYLGNHEHRKLSKELKHRYFYPKDVEKVNHEEKDRRVTADEGK